MTVTLMSQQPDNEALARVVQRVAALPPLTAKYAARSECHTIEAFSELPVLTKDELNAAMPFVLREIHSTGAYLYGSGGTMSAPKLSLIPSSMYARDIAAHWRPIENSDLVANLYKPGRLWSSHNFYNSFAAECGATVLTVGALEDHELPVWLPFMRQHGVTALAGTPSQIAHILEFCVRTGTAPPVFADKLLWVGEPYSHHTDALVREYLPGAQRHGLYGSTETWVIGFNGPKCPADTFHVLPYQYVEIVNGDVLVTNLHRETISPVLRYRLGDRGRFVSCPCGRSDQAVQLLGRAHEQFKFLNILVSGEEIASTVKELPEVEGVQVATFSRGNPDERMQLRVLLRDGARADTALRIRAYVLTRVYRLGWAITSNEDAFEVIAVDRLETNPRTAKTPTVVHHAEAREAPRRSSDDAPVPRGAAARAN
jgi:phenylacetate-coenzyme A ligase PaaK-like adenylate-forming protein